MTAKEERELILKYLKNLDDRLSKLEKSMIRGGEAMKAITKSLDSIKNNPVVQDYRQEESPRRKTRENKFDPSDFRSVKFKELEEAEELDDSFVGGRKTRSKPSLTKVVCRECKEVDYVAPILAKRGKRYVCNDCITG